jgi:hypothetical protein
MTNQDQVAATPREDRDPCAIDDYDVMVRMPEELNVGQLNRTVRALRERLYQARVAKASTFKRHGDPHGCPERTGPNCLGVRMHCRLEPHEAGTPHAMEASGPYVLAHDQPAPLRHVFEIVYGTEGAIDFFVAETKEHAAKLFNEHYADPDYVGEYRVRQLDDDKELTVGFTDAPKGQESDTQACRQWATGPAGLLASTELDA